MKLRRSAVLLLTSAASMAGAATLGFQSDILPIFNRSCTGCHGANNPQAGLDLRSLDGVVRGGRSGPAVKPGKAEGSLLIEKLVSKKMPPTPEKLPESDIARIRQWIDSGTDFAPPTEADILPVFQMRCVVCHGKRKQEGGLDLRTLASQLKGGKSGPVITPGKPEDSLLLKRITAGQMPPPKLLVEYFVRPPSNEEVDLLRKWIAGGAQPAPVQSANDRRGRTVSEKDRSHWSFQKPQRPPVPRVGEASLVRNPIDAFLLQKLETQGLTYNPAAEKLTLLRRATLDLTGLPPTTQEVEAFLADQHADAYEKVVNRLLESPHYGERWGRFWLDAAGYSDSEGIIDEDLIRGNAWRYRDYVIRSLNADKPYNQFLMEQIAGDEMVDYRHVKPLTPEMREKIIATGFLRQVPDGTYSPANGSVAERMNVIADEIEVLSSSVMGLTVGCARCHDHKYDPLPQRDYYRLSAILQTSYDPYDWVKPTQRYLDLAPEEELRKVEEHNKPVEAEIKKLEDAIEVKSKPHREKLLAERLSALPEDVRHDLKLALDVPEAKRSAVQKYLADKFQEIWKISEEDLTKRLPEFRAEVAVQRKSVGELKRKLKEKPQIRALYEMGGEPSPSYLLRRGEAQLIGEAVDPGPPAILSASLAPYKPSAPFADSSGRRLALAQWLTQPDHPLTARVLVNRLWMHHFGRGIVASVSNFGRLGTPPSHPELLDWLATEFVQSGWSMKAMHRLIMTSSAYRQSSQAEPRKLPADPENILVSRMPLHRLDAEQFHDSILAVTGQINLQQFGPAVAVKKEPAGEVVPEGLAKDGFRRSIYLLQRRTTPVTLLEVFDQPPMSPNCIQRSHSTVATQALELTNSNVLRDRSRFLAGRLLDENPGNVGHQIEQTYLRALSRRPTSEEIRDAKADLERLAANWRKYLDQEKHDSPRQETARWFALADFCQAILSSAEFAYID